MPLLNTLIIDIPKKHANVYKRAMSGRLTQQQRNSLGKAKQKLYARLKHARDNLYWHATKVFSKLGVKAVLIPELEKMVTDDVFRGIGLSRKSKLALVHIAIARLRVFLKRKGMKVLPVGESYTTQTCGKCGKTLCGEDKITLGVRVYRCQHPTCGYVSGRDVNAARNILWRYVALACPDIYRKISDTYKSPVDAGRNEAGHDSEGVESVPNPEASGALLPSHGSDAAEACTASVIDQS